MTADVIYSKLLPIVTNYLPEDVTPDQINKEADLTQELNINSAYLVDIVLDVEDTFDIEFSNDDMENLRNLGDAVEIISSKLEVE